MRISATTLRGASRELEQFVREVRTILNGGWRFRDQGQVRSFRWSSTQSSVLVGYQGTAPPLAVIVLSMAQTQASQEVKTSGVSCSWVYSIGGLLVTDIGTATPGTDYDVTVLIVEG